MESRVVRPLLVLLALLALARGEGDVLPDLSRLLAAQLASQGASSCAEDSRTFLRRLHNFSIDAVSMYDASVKTPVGVLPGSTFQLGHYDECVGVASAQYCLAHLHYRPLGNVSSDSAWLRLLTSQDDSKIPRERVEWALCVPASCSPQQLGDAFRDVVAPLAQAWGVVLEAGFDHTHCSVKDDPALVMGPGSLVYLCFLAFLIFLVAMGSVLDSRLCRDADENPDKAFRRKGLVHRLLISFSAPKNVASLTQMRPSEPFLDVIHFHKAIFMMLIVGGHRLLSVTGHPVYNGSSVEQFPTSVEKMLVANGPAIVDVFFTLGGFLLSYLFTADLKKHPGAFRILLAVINRYLRLTPLYALVIAFYIFVLPYMGDGPYWKAIVVEEQRLCQDWWWANVLYVNNYIGAMDMCMLQSWYLSADFQLCVLGLVLTYVVHRCPRIGWTLLAVVTVMSMVVPFVIVYTNGFYPILRPYWTEMQNLRKTSVMFREVYIKAHARATPYLLGIIGGFLMRNKTVANTKLPQVVGWCVYFASWVMAFVTMMTSYLFFIPGRTFNSAESAAYFVGQKVTFSAVTLGCLLSVSVCRLETLRRLLWWKPFVVLSRMTYTAFVVHMAAQIYAVGSAKTLFIFDAYNMLWSALSDYVFAYTVAFFGFILVEAPFRNLVKILIG